MFNLERFKSAQRKTYDNALIEIKNAQKRGHWIWYIFPQIKGLGRSYNSSYYAIQSREEAIAFLSDEYLGHNLLEISQVLLSLNESNPIKIFGFTDSMKLKSCMTLFSDISNDETSVFQKNLDKFFNGEKDIKTINILNVLSE